MKNRKFEPKAFVLTLVVMTALAFPFGGYALNTMQQWGIDWAVAVNQDFQPRE